MGEQRILWCCLCGQANNTHRPRCFNCLNGRHSWGGVSEQETQACRKCGLLRNTRRGRSHGAKRWYRYYWFEGQTPVKEAPRCKPKTASQYAAVATDDVPL